MARRVSLPSIALRKSSSAKTFVMLLELDPDADPKGDRPTGGSRVQAAVLSYAIGSVQPGEEDADRRESVTHNLSLYPVLSSRKPVNGHVRLIFGRGVAHLFHVCARSYVPASPNGTT